MRTSTPHDVTRWKGFSRNFNLISVILRLLIESLAALFSRFPWRKILGLELLIPSRVVWPKTIGVGEQWLKVSDHSQ